MNKLSRYFFWVWMLFPAFSAMAQDGIESLSPDDYLNLQLPPLDILFENAKNSAAVDFYTVKMEEEASALKTEKRSWLKYFRVGSTYQWGLMGKLPFLILHTPFYQFRFVKAGITSATLSIPLDDFFDRGNLITRQELKPRLRGLRWRNGTRTEARSSRSTPRR